MKSQRYAWRSCMSWILWHVDPKVLHKSHFSCTVISYYNLACKYAISFLKCLVTIIIYNISHGCTVFVRTTEHITCSCRMITILWIGEPVSCQRIGEPVRKYGLLSRVFFFLIYTSIWLFLDERVRDGPKSLACHKTCTHYSIHLFHGAIVDLDHFQDIWPFMKWGGEEP